MKALKISALTLALFSSVAMANVVTDTADSMVGGAKTLLKTATNPAAVSLELGTLGYGANVAWGINDSVELQAGWAGMDLSASVDIDPKDEDSYINWDKVLGEEYKNFTGAVDLDIKTSNPYLGVQMRPMNNWLTIGAGVIVPDHKISTSLTANVVPPAGMTTIPAGSKAKLTIDNVEYELENNTTVSIHAKNHNKLAPYATLGFRPNINNRFGLFAEVGAAYVGKYDVTVDAPDTLTGTGANSGKKLKDELQKEVEDTSLSWYPIAKAGLTYRF